MTTSHAVVGAAAAVRAQAEGTGLKTLLRNPRIIFIALFASLGGFLYGYQQGVLGQAFVMYSFQQKFPDVHASANRQGWLTSILQLGGWLGSITCGVICEIYSRKYSLFVGALFTVLGSFLCAGAQDTSYLFAGRFFTGIGVGNLSATGPLYNSELAPPEFRGLLVSCQQLAITIGIMLAYWISYGSNNIGGTGESQSDWAWRTPMLAQGVPAVILAVGVWALPYSPRWLVKQGRDEEALASLCKLRGRPSDDRLVQIEYLDIKAEDEFERRAFIKRTPELSEAKRANQWLREFKSYIHVFQTMDSFKRVAIASLIMFFQQWSGIDAIIYYMPLIFQNLGLTSNKSSLLATGITGVINVCTTLPALFIIDRVGRRPLLFAASAGMLTSMVIIGSISSKYSEDWSVNPSAGWACVVMIWFYIVNFAYGWGPCSWTLIAEIFPLSTRAKGTSIAASANWMNNFAVALMVPSMLEAISWGLYFFFSGWLFLSVFFIYFFVPETKGKTLEEMDAVFGSVSSTEDLAELASIQEDVGLLSLLNGVSSEPAWTDGGEKGEMSTLEVSRPKI